MKAYKGFNRDMTCRGFQYAEGETYELPDGVEAKLCKSGFHACEMPLDCFNYYNPCQSVFCEVELEVTDEELPGDSKRVGRRIKIGKRLTLEDIIDEQIDFVRKHFNESRWIDSATSCRSFFGTVDDCSVNRVTSPRSINCSTSVKSINENNGTSSINSATGEMSVNRVTRWGATNSTTGSCSINSATDQMSINSATGRCSVNHAMADYSINGATAVRCVNIAIGYGSVNVSTGNDCGNSGGAGTISVGWGAGNRCKGDVGAYLVVCERGEWDGDKYPMIGEPVLIKIDGKTYKADTWYMLKNGEVVECE